jgi:diguanylate cyclase (GGDEF)-like protein
MQAAGDRDTSSADRDSSAADLALAVLDGLTGVYTRGAGLLALQREVQRSHRTGQPLALLFVDVDGLKAINDSGGHASGDRVLVRVARALTAGLRPYDIVIRYGGDEFLCAFAGAASLNVDERVQSMNAALSQGPAPTTVSVGMARLRSDDTLEALIRRADEDLYLRRSLN